MMDGRTEGHFASALTIQIIVAFFPSCFFTFLFAIISCFYFTFYFFIHMIHRDHTEIVRRQHDEKDVKADRIDQALSRDDTTVPVPTVIYILTYT